MIILEYTDIPEETRNEEVILKAWLHSGIPADSMLKSFRTSMNMDEKTISAYPA